MGGEERQAAGGCEFLTLFASCRPMVSFPSNTSKMFSPSLTSRRYPTHSSDMTQPPSSYRHTPGFSMRLLFPLSPSLLLGAFEGVSTPSSASPLPNHRLHFLQQVAADPRPPSPRNGDRRSSENPLLRRKFLQPLSKKMYIATKRRGNSTGSEQKHRARSDVRSREACFEGEGGGRERGGHCRGCGCTSRIFDHPLNSVSAIRRPDIEPVTRGHLKLLQHIVVTLSSPTT
jgi:hypothetical protein